MNKDEALNLANLIKKARPTAYEITKMETVNESLPQFHQWTHGKQTLAGFEVTRYDTRTSFYFLSSIGTVMATFI